MNLFCAFFIGNVIMNNNGDSFILMIYRSTCFNSNLRKVV